ncbi:allantoinase, mitochondrial-like isoform X2 [Oryzias latipes]
MFLPRSCSLFQATPQLTYQQSEAWMMTAWPPTFQSTVTGLPHDGFALNIKRKFHAEKDVHKKTEEISDSCRYSTFLQSRPDIMEVEAIHTVIHLCLQYRVRCHIVHLSSAEPLELIEEARQARAPLTVETTHHYLNLCAESIPAGATQFKCCPPIRSSANQEQLWSALKRGLIDMVVSDHSPCTPDLKKLDFGDFMQAWGGISSLQFGGRPIRVLWVFKLSVPMDGHREEQLVCLESSLEAHTTALMTSTNGMSHRCVQGRPQPIWCPRQDFQLCTLALL